MKKLFIILLFLAISVFAYAEEDKLPVIIDSDEISYLQEKGKLVARGNVVMKQKGVELSCDEAEYDATSNIAHVKGNVKIVKDGGVAYGEDVVFNFNTSNAEITGIKVHDAPMYGAAKEGQKVGNEKYILKSGHLTTCDLEKPHWRLVAKKITIYPGDRVIARNVVVKVGDVSVMYLPYYSQSLKDKIPLEEFSPGKNDEWGMFTLSRWRYRPNDENKGRIYFDWYDKRGLGLGFANKTESKQFGKAFFRYYGLEDKLYREGKRIDLWDIYPQRKGVEPKFLEDDRYLAQFSYSWDPTPDLSIEAEFHKFSDIYFMKDFFEREYKKQEHPLSYALFDYNLPGAALSLLAQKRANRFWAETEYLPQLEFDFFDTNIGTSNFYFESNDKLSHLNNAFVNSGVKDTALRLHSENTLTYANKIKWLSVKPYVTSFLSFYSRDQIGDDNRFREAREVGITLNTKLYKLLPGGFKVFGQEVNRARHIITPEVTYLYRHDPSIPDSQLYQFDSVDTITRDHYINFALKNKLQLKNQDKTWDFIYFSPSVNYRIDPEGRKSRFETISSSLEFYPKDGLSLTASSDYDIWTSRISAFNLDLSTRGVKKVFERGQEVEREDYSFSFGHRYSRQNSTQSTINFSYQLTPKLQLKNYLRYEWNTEDLERQQYGLRADLHCWWLDLGIDLDRSTKGSKDLTFWFMFTLKDFDDISIDFDQTYKGAKATY